MTAIQHRPSHLSAVPTLRITPADEPTSRTITPAEYLVDITHRRRDPIEYAFSQRGTSWLIDLDAVPRLPHGFGWLAGFSSRDHLGSREQSIRANLDAFLAEHGVDRPAAILMLANPRVLGYVFNPLSVFYCFRTIEDLRSRTVSQVVAEVRNTYGGRHSYLLSPDQDGKASTDKAFYVSPFYPVDGHYTMLLPAPSDQLLVNVTLHRSNERPFAAVVTGRRRHSESASSLWSALRSPLATRAVMFGIKRHGIRLYTKGLRPFPRCTDDAPAARQPDQRTAQQTSQHADQHPVQYPAAKQTAATCPHHESGSL